MREVSDAARACAARGSGGSKTTEILVGGTGVVSPVGDDVLRLLVAGAARA